MSNIPRKPQNLNSQATVIPKIPQPVGQSTRAHTRQPAGSQAIIPANPQSAPPMPLGWLFRPVGARGRKGIAPAERAMYFFSGIGLWAWGAYLSNRFMQVIFPALRNPQLTTERMLAGIVMTAIFSVIEFFIWKGDHTPIIWLLILVIFAIDIYINVAGHMDLFGVTAINFEIGGGLILLLSIVTAILPEKLISRAWEG